MIQNIRNFVVISHIDHGKSTLADRFLELTGTIDKRRMKPQYLDQLELERERGITIKMAPVRMLYEHPARIDADQNADERGLLYEDLTYKIRGLLFRVYNKLGPSYKESVYGNAIEEEFKKNYLPYEREKIIDVIYDDKKVGVYKPDFIIDKKIILEIKAQSFTGKLEVKQTWHYLKGSHYRLALLVNFGSKELQIKRIVYDTIREYQRSNLRESAQVEEYILNLIDTPGHSDFSYEVSRALHSVEGAILLVDATQGIQAQTLVNFRLAKKAGLKVLGAINKIDIANREDISKCAKSLADLLGEKEEIFQISGKTGKGVEELLEAVVEKIPEPSRSKSDSTHKSALIFDSFYDEHKGIVAAVRVFEGNFLNGEAAKLFSLGYEFKIKELGYFAPQLKPTSELREGEIGYIATGIKDPERFKIGDTIGNKVFLSYEAPKPVVFVSLYPDEPEHFDDFKTALFKLRLNDSSLKLEPDFNLMLGRGFQAGFLGQLHFEITVERLEGEFGIKTVSTFPFVSYKVKPRSGASKEEYITVQKIDDLPQDFDEILEPTIQLEIISPGQYLGSILKLKEIFRMSEIRTEAFEDRILIKAVMPLTSLLSDFDGQLKSVSQGMASFSYELYAYSRADLLKVEILVAGEAVPGLTVLMYKDSADRESRKLLVKLKEILPRRQFAQSLQAEAGGRIIARENIPALRKDVTGYLYGGDRTRKMKLWQKQKKGKKKLKEMGRVSISANTFKELLKH